MDIQTYNDGVVKIYGTTNTAEPGRKPIITPTPDPKETLRYEERTVGVQRYNLGLQNGIRIDRVLRCPRRPDVFTDDLAKPIDGAQYEIKQVQYPENVKPLSMDLSLQRVVSKSGTARI